MLTTSNDQTQPLPFQEHPEPLTHDLVAAADHRFTQTRIRIRIPKQYHQDPVISRLISHYGITVNITAALLGANARDDGWFDLELQGQVSQIESALTYLNDLDLEIWYDRDCQNEGW